MRVAIGSKAVLSAAGMAISSRCTMVLPSLNTTRRMMCSPFWSPLRRPTTWYQSLPLRWVAAASPMSSTSSACNSSTEALSALAWL